MARVVRERKTDAQGSNMTRRSPLEDCSGTSKIKWYCFPVAACMFHNPGVHRGRKCNYDPIKTKINEKETGENNPGLTAAAGREIPFFPGRPLPLVFVSLHARPYSSRAANFFPRYATHPCARKRTRRGNLFARRTSRCIFVLAILKIGTVALDSSVLFSAKEI